MSAHWFRPPADQPLPTLELFAGCGAMAYGLRQAGLNIVRMVEASSRAVATVNQNLEAAFPELANSAVEAEDVRKADFAKDADKVRVITGGPPCEFSSGGGKHGGRADPRNMWPDTVRAVGEIGPEAFLFENVKGMTEQRTGNYAEEVCRLLAEPRPGLRYHVELFSFNTADYGAAQIRKRIFIAGFRTDLFASAPPFPRPTHSREALLYDKWVTGAYWRRHGIEPPAPTEKDLHWRDKLMLAPPPHKPHRTIRDAIAGLGEPNGENSHVLNTKRKSAFYDGHEGSDIDFPAKALKCGAIGHGVSGGENAIRFPDGTGRQMTVREAARLQGLPDSYVIPHKESESMLQLGNGLPVEVAEFFGRWLVNQCRLREATEGEVVLSSAEAAQLR